MRLLMANARVHYALMRLAADMPNCLFSLRIIGSVRSTTNT
ncbi:unnamed protein product [Photorhabdus laumondii subsp. laumondii TTO1]|uniref:Photorhabdus luminescens subsp. laumondii TTO1 complete genome segment 1/17 n=1 Tax=Photorhabdus laumondii subsp. laumondii (strain DSM 15139 / CIP 105565 / TT01) TaxID=243265 RepID=Q7N9N0_PHOLL|nr:unnamed protein product [Photorhabdus laumondii subsp. laumondii TTO1]